MGKEIGVSVARGLNVPNFFKDVPIFLKNIPRARKSILG